MAHNTDLQHARIKLDLLSTTQFKMKPLLSSKNCGYNANKMIHTSLVQVRKWHMPTIPTCDTPGSNWICLARLGSKSSPCLAVKLCTSTPTKDDIRRLPTRRMPMESVPIVSQTINSSRLKRIMDQRNSNLLS